MALNIYIALCYYKLDYFDISQEVLENYLIKYPDSIVAINLKACNRFRLFDGRTAEMFIKGLDGSDMSFGSDLVRHNMVVFRGGEGALQVFPTLIDIIPEARLNLAIYYLRMGDVKKAEDLMKDVQPTVSYEYVLKGAVHATLSQQLGSVSIGAAIICKFSQDLILLDISEGCEFCFQILIAFEFYCLFLRKNI